MTPEAFDPALLSSEMRRGGDAIESFQGQDRIGELIGAVVQHRAGQRQEFLLHRLRVRERGRLARRIGMEPFKTVAYREQMYAVHTG